MTYSATVLADTPSFFWLLNETSGTSAADSSGNSHAGTYQTGATVNQSSVPGVVTTKSVALSGATARVSGAFQNTTTDFSAEVWFKTTSSTGGGVLALCKNNAAVVAGTDGKLTFVMWNGSTSPSCTSAAAYNDGNWHHVVATYNHTSHNMFLYVDGVQVATTTSATTAATASGGEQTDVGYSLNVVNNWWGGASAPSTDNLTGNFCAYAEYSAELSSARVSAHYAARLAASGSAALLSDLP
jgi:hypothetical protein